MNGLSIECHGEELMLLPEKGVFWPRASALLVADLHLGKSATFRALGAPVPEQCTQSTLDCLAALLDRLQPDSLWILGDLFHAKEAMTGAPRQSFERWLCAHSELNITLVIGNHDLKSGLIDLPFSTSKCLEHPPFVLCHAPQEHPSGYVISGHIHPAYRVEGRGRQSQRLPCFQFSERYAVLPAFGEFTGMMTIDPREGDQIFVVAGQSVLKASQS
jgi:DNA ligase-associated metallophosphoesterase